MCTLKFWSICAFLLLSDHSFSMKCKQHILRDRNAQCIRLLIDMGGDFPVKCLKENVKLMFPEGVYDITSKSQDHDIAAVAYDALRDVVKIFNNSLVSTSWDPEKLGLFKHKLSLQIENLEQCVSMRYLQSCYIGYTSYTCAFIYFLWLKKVRGEMTFSGDGSFPSEDNGRLKSYFERLTTFLKEKGQSACAWEVVRKEVSYSLKKLQEFL
ncbi:interferon a3-like [Anguilla anguilla]|uniref:interferon a3-like n=1 Tax=Anguilla anguilla TaxID=7936 RepID=UPI0015A7B003|nr:interferon a3-like [Anguilla anguilla]